MDGVETWSRTLFNSGLLAALKDCGVPASAYRTSRSFVGSADCASWRGY